MRIFQAKLGCSKDILHLMQEIGVDSYGIKIMLPKAVGCLIRLDGISNIAANIIKQEMLSLGADAAVARGALTGKTKTGSCLLMGSLAQFRGLSIKLKKQPFGLNNLSADLSRALTNFQKESFRLDLGRYKLNLPSGAAAIMGVINLTPDSFSGDGLYSRSVQRYASSVDIEKAVDAALKMQQEGADIIDIGGESSRPGAYPVSAREEIKRVIPALKKIAKKIKIPVSIDTYKPEVARAALVNGAVMVNDITGLKNLKLANMAARCKAAVVLMHMRGSPRSMQANPRYAHLIEEIKSFLAAAIERAQDAGIDSKKIIIDPGIGFGKSLAHNLGILKRLDEFKMLGKPIMVGVSRKSFIGKILNAEADKRIFGTLAACLAAVNRGAKVLRVHDCLAARQALDVYSAINEGERYA